MSTTSTRRGRGGLVGLLVAQVISITGTRMSMVALPWFVLETTGSALQTGLVAFAEMLPYVVAAVFAAPVTDRIGARRTSVVCDVASTFAVGLIPVLHLADLLSFPLLLGLVALAGALRGPGDTAKHVLMPDVAAAAGVPLERAAAMYDGVSRAASLIGAPLAGVLIAVTGAAEVLLVDAATFGLAALVIVVGVAAVAPAPGDTGEDEEGTYLSRLTAGLVFLWREPLLRAICLMVFVTNLLDQAYASVLLPVWAAEEGHGAIGLGVVSGTFALGATIGAVVMVGIAPRLPRRTTYALGFLLAGSPRFLVMAFGAPLGVVVAVSLAGGLACGAINPILAAVELERIPERLRARAISAMTALAWGGMPLGGLVAGWAASRLGVIEALAVFGIVYLLATCLPLGRTWRDMDRRPEPVSLAA